MSLPSADDSPFKILGYIRLALTLGNKSLPALVSPHLSPDAMLVGNNIMKAFGVKLDWVAELHSLRDSNITILAIHTAKPIRSKYCFVIIQNCLTQVSLCLFLISTLYHYKKHSFIRVPAQHNLKKIR